MFSKLSLVNFKPSVKWRQFLVTVFLGPISFGISIGWTSPVLPQLQSNNYTSAVSITMSEGSWVGSMLTLGVLVSAVPVGFLVDRFGAKKCSVCVVLPILIFTLMVIFAQNVYLLCLGRFFAGFAAGSFTALSSPYLSEISDVSLRGSVLSFFEFLIYSGVLIVSVGGAYLDYTTLTMVFGVFTLFVGIGFYFFPESPWYLVRKNQSKKAAEALRFYRGDDFNVDDAIECISKSLSPRKATNLQTEFRSKSVVRGLIACIGLTIFQQLSGTDSIIFYNVQICQTADTGMDAYTLATILSAVQLLGHIIIIFLAEKVKRRILLGCSSGLCALALFLLGLYFSLKEYSNYFFGMNYVPLISISLFWVGFGSGIGPLPWAINGEVFPTNVKGIACGLIGSVHWLCLFINTKVFPVVMEDVGAQYPFYFYGVCMLICIVFVKYYVPETKGKSLEQIQEELNA